MGLQDSREQLKRRIAVSFGTEEADLVFKNAKIVNVFTNELEKGDVAISGEYIAGIGHYSGKVEIDVSDAVLCPAFIDGHIHLESSMISPVEFAKSVVPHGTSAVITDPHEIANVCGTAGIEFMLSETDELPLDVFFMLPSCVPSTALDESGAVLLANDLERFYDNDRVLGLAEMMNSFGTIRSDSDIIDKIAGAKSHGKLIDGHAPGLHGKDLNAYVVAGVGSDHECSTAREGIEKIKRGQWVMIREGTAAKNLAALIPLFGKRYYSRCMLVTDDKHPGDLISKGHIDYIIREAAKLGENPIFAIKMASFNAAQYFGLKDMGAVAPGYRANIVVVDSLESFSISSVYHNGQLVASDGHLCAEIPPRKTDEALRSSVISSFHLDEIKPEALKIPQAGRFKRVIGLTKGELLTKDLIVPNETSGDENIAPGVLLDRDIVKLAVIERHKNTGHIGLGYVYGYGLKRGAIASSIAHDSHNLIVIGTNDEDIALAANVIRKNQGGLAITCGGKVLGELALPIAGLMCESDAAVVENALEELKKTSREMGVSAGIDPFMTLAFISLPVIPELRLTTKGLVDTATQQYVPVIFG